MPTNETKKAKIDFHKRKKDVFFVKKYDEASDANRTDKLPHKKV